MGIRKSIVTVKTKDAIQATLKALLNFDGSSSADKSALTCLSSSRSVGRSGSAFSFALSSVDEGEEGDVRTDEALMDRVVSQEKGLGRARETVTLTIRPVIIAARLPANVEYSSPVVETVTAPKY